MKKRFVYFYLMRPFPKQIQPVVPMHVDFWKRAGLDDYRGGPFADGSGGLISAAKTSPQRGNSTPRDLPGANGAPELTRIFCAVDLVWAEELSHPRYGVHFERPTSLAAGDDACRFEFSRRALSGAIPVNVSEHGQAHHISRT